MRAQNQQDLIYRRGQAGITKASVTIVFDNSDRESSPPGMENYTQIIVTTQVRPSPFCHLPMDQRSLSTDFVLDRPSKSLPMPL